MNRRDLLLNTLQKVTAQPRQHLEKVIDHWAAQMPGKVNWKADVPDAMRVELEHAFEKEAPGILAWYVRQMMASPELCEDRVENIQKENAKRNRRPRPRR
jgi:hypothetical protein